MCHAAVRVNSISIHSLRIEGDSRCRNRHCVTEHFNPLPPHGGRRNQHGYQDTENGFQSTPSVWRETLGATVDFVHWVFQSTPSVWRETVYGISGNVDLNISIHSLRMEGDRPPSRSIFSDPVFQSTPSVWRETIASNINHTLELSFQSTPSAWRETDSLRCLGNAE